MGNTVLFACTVVECDDRHHAVVQSEDRHEEEALQLEIHTEYRRCGGGEHKQDLVHSECHDRSDRHHQDGRYTDRIDALYRRCIETHTRRMNMDLVIARDIEEDREQRCDDLPEYGSKRRSGHAHFRETEVAEDENRVKNDIQNCAESLRDHRVKCKAGRLQQTFHRDLQENADRQPADDRHILHTIFENLRVLRLRFKKDAGAEETEQAECGEADQSEQNAVICSLIRLLIIFLTQTAGEQSVDTDTGTGGDRDHQILDRERERDGGQGVFIDL